MQWFIICRVVEGCIRKMFLKKAHVETSNKNKNGLDFFWLTT